VSAVAGVVYCAALRLTYPAVWADLMTVFRRVLPAGAIRRHVVARLRRAEAVA
jgi:hypothetical protein